MEERALFLNFLDDYGSVQSPSLFKRIDSLFC
jgi:hypothetical protein